MLFEKNIEKFSNNLSYLRKNGIILKLEPKFENNKYSGLISYVT